MHLTYSFNLFLASKPLRRMPCPSHPQEKLAGPPILMKILEHPSK